MTMQQRYFFYGAPLNINVTSGMSLQERLKATGMNTGNLFIAKAVEKHIGTPQGAEIIGYPFDVDRINHEYDKLIIPASNFLNSYSEWSAVAETIEKITIPIVVIGLGAQASHYTDKIELKEGTVNFLKLLADKSISMGVRGNFTAEKLFDIGITNVDVIGCPTIFYNANPKFQINKKPFQDDFKVAINFGRKKENLHLLNLAVESDLPFFAQSELLELSLFEGEAGKQDLGKDPLYKRYKSKKPEELASYFMNNTKVYYNIDEWISEISTYDFSLGPRLHGNMIALQCGIPSVWFAHDTRTKEICSLANLPYVPIERISEFQTIGEFYEFADYTQFNKTYPLLHNNYINFLEKNELEHNLEKSISKKEYPHSQLYAYYEYQQEKHSITQSSENSETKTISEQREPSNQADVNPVKAVLTRFKDTLRREMLIFRMRDHVLFDPKWYYEQYLKEKSIPGDPLRHYLEVGWRMNHNPGPLFDSNWYKAKNRDVAEAQVEPLQHYLNHGWKKGRNPTALFNIAWYFENYPDIAQKGVEPFEHYLVKGWKKGNNPNSLFNVKWYLQQHPELTKEPLTHYLTIGWKKGSSPSQDFDSQWYLNQYPDVKAAEMEPLTHYLRHGKAEGRKIKALE